jgi:hypothetical protein
MFTFGHRLGLQRIERTTKSWERSKRSGQSYYAGDTPRFTRQCVGTGNSREVETRRHLSEKKANFLLAGLAGRRWAARASQNVLQETRRAWVCSANPFVFAPGTPRFSPATSLSPKKFLISKWSDSDAGGRPRIGSSRAGANPPLPNRFAGRL